MKRMPTLSLFPICTVFICLLYPAAGPCSPNASGWDFAALRTPEGHPGLSDSSTYDSGAATAARRLSFLRKRSVGILLGMGGAAMVSKSFEDDDRVAAALDRSPLDGILDVGNIYGNGLTAGLGSLGLIAAGKLAGSERLTSAGGNLAEALVLTWASVWTVKLAVDADRPSGGDYSFPSGHAATAFAAAPVLTRHFGWKAGIPAYALAATTAMGRMEEHKHYLADVLFGAAMGFVIGSEVTSGSGLAVIMDHITVRRDGLGLMVSF